MPFIRSRLQRITIVSSFSIDIGPRLEQPLGCFLETKKGCVVKRLQIIDKVFELVSFTWIIRIIDSEPVQEVTTKILTEQSITTICDSLYLHYAAFSYLSMREPV